MNSRFWLWLTLTLCILLSCMTQDAPTKIVLSKSIDILMHQQEASFPDPFAGLQPVGELSVWQNGQPSTLCSIVPANFSTTYKGVMVFYENNTAIGRMSPIASFTDLKHMKNAIDTISFRGKYYVVFEDGVVNIYTVVKNGTKGLEQQSRLELRDGEIFDEGYFVANDQTLLYVTAKKLWHITDNNITSVSGYIPSPDFQNVRLYGNRLFVAMGSSGFAIYNNVSAAGLAPPDIYNASNLLVDTYPDISDIEYSVLSGILFVLDRVEGVKQYGLGSGKVLNDGSVNYIKHRSCENMLLHDSYILLTCPNLVIYDIYSKKVIESPESDIFPQDIQAFGKGNETQVVLVGDSHIAYYLNIQKNPIYTSVINPTKLLLEADNTILFINDYEIVRAKVTPHFESVRCGMPNSLHEGLHQLEIRAVTACNESFLKKIGMVLSLASNTTCEYISPLTIYVWVEHSVKWRIFAVIGSVIGVVFIALSVWYCFKNCRFSRTFEQLNEELGSTEIQLGDRDQRSSIPESAIKPKPHKKGENPQ